MAENKVGSIEYQMARDMANELLSSRKGADKNMQPQDFLIKYVNEECGLMYNCTRVILI